MPERITPEERWEQWQRGIRVLRSESFETMGCSVCGARASWVDSVIGPDYWTLPCGHRKVPPIPIKILTTTVKA